MVRPAEHRHRIGSSRAGLGGGLGEARDTQRAPQTVPRRAVATCPDAPQSSATHGPCGPLLPLASVHRRCCRCASTASQGKGSSGSRPTKAPTQREGIAKRLLAPTPQCRVMSVPWMICSWVEVMCNVHRGGQGCSVRVENRLSQSSNPQRRALCRPTPKIFNGFRQRKNPNFLVDKQFCYHFHSNEHWRVLLNFGEHALSRSRGEGGIPVLEEVTCSVTRYLCTLGVNVLFLGGGHVFALCGDSGRHSCALGQGIPFRKSQQPCRNYQRSSRSKLPESVQPACVPSYATKCFDPPTPV